MFLHTGLSVNSLRPCDAYICIYIYVSLSFVISGSDKAC